MVSIEPMLHKAPLVNLVYYLVSILFGPSSKNSDLIV